MHAHVYITHIWVCVCSYIISKYIYEFLGKSWKLLTHVYLNTTESLII